MTMSTDSALTDATDFGRVVLLRGAAADLPLARLDADLTVSRFQRGGGRPDARLADPSLERAFEETATQVRAASRAEGYAVGWAEGLRAANERLRVEAALADQHRQRQTAEAASALRGALTALADGAASLEQRAVTPAADLRDAVLAAALSLTEMLLGRELALADAPGLDALRRALTLTPAGRPITARLNPADLPAVREALAAMPAGSLGREVTLVSDPGVEPAGCIAECDATRVDAQLSTALARVRAVLSA